MRSAPLALVVLLVWLLPAFALVGGCSRAPAPPGPVLASPSASASVAPLAAAGPCDAELPCTVYPSPLAAFTQVLAENPKVLAVGETHAQKDAPGVASATKRFTEALLPALAGKASDLVIELWVGNPACAKKVERVAAQQKEVTATQAPTNPNEFMLLGDVAKKLGVFPHALLPGCDEYERILDAGGGDVDAMLSMIARLTARDVAALVDERQASAPESMIVAYGGAMHNDAAPRPGHEAWSFGPAVIAKTGGRYVELDLIVPELVKDEGAWRAQAWYPHYRADAHRGETLLFKTGARSFALIFPKTPPA